MEEPDRNETDLAAVGERIKLIRRKLNLKQKDLAHLLNISGASLSEIEKGKYFPNFEIVKTLNRQFNINLNYIFFGEGEMLIRPGSVTWPRLEELASNSEDIRKFIYYFEQSAIFRYDQLSKAEDFLLDHGPKIEKEIQARKLKK